MSAMDDLRAQNAGQRPAGARRVELTPASAIRSERVRWLWRERIPLRGVTIIGGEKGLGKSTLTNAQMVAKITLGALDGELAGRPTDVLIATAEDDWRAVVKPRLMAHGADLDRVHRVRAVDEHGEALLTLPDDVPDLETEIEQLRAAGREVGLVVIDPISAFLSESIDSHRDASVRRALAPLAQLADRCSIAIGVVAHLGKDDSKKLLQRIGGSVGFVNAARSVLVLVRDPDDPDGDQGHHRLLVHAGANWGRYAPTLAAQVESRTVDVDDGSQADVGYFRVIGESSVTLDDLQGGHDADGPDCEEAIGAALADGPRPSLDVKAQVAERVGCSRKTVERAAMRMRNRGELVKDEAGFPRTTTWALDSRDTTARPALDSRDTTAGPVGTFSNSLRVPTTRRDVPIEEAGASRDSGDPTREAVPTEEDLARAERLALRNGDMAGGST